MAKKKNQINIDYGSLPEEIKAKYDEYKLKFNSKNIFQLREDAKKMLISSATTFSKQELVNQMLEKIISYYMNNDFNANVDKEIEIKLIEDFRNAIYIDGQEESGYLKINERNGELVSLDNQKNGIFVPQGIINEFCLREGDFVTARVENVGDKKGVFDVSKVNGRQIPAEKTKLFDNITPTKQSEKLVINDTFITKGGRIIIQQLDISTIANIIDSAKSQNLKLLVAFLDEFPENVCSIIDEIKDSYVYELCDSDVKTQIDTAVFALNVAKRYAENGDNALLIVRNLDALPLDTARKIYGSARSFDNGSLTVIVQSNDEKFYRMATEVI